MQPLAPKREVRSSPTGAYPAPGRPPAPPAHSPAPLSPRAGTTLAALHVPPPLVQRGFRWLQTLSRRVRVHTDDVADRFAGALGADAVTVGVDVFFRAGRFEPATPRGLALVAHELAHVRQHETRDAALGEHAPGGLGDGPEDEALAVERTVYRLLAPRAAAAPSPAFASLASRAPAPHLALPSPAARAAAPAALAAGSTAAATPMRAAEGRDVVGGEAGELPGHDPAEIADEVYRLLERRLRIDKERAGIGRDGWPRS